MGKDGFATKLLTGYSFSKEPSRVRRLKCSRFVIRDPSLQLAPTTGPDYLDKIEPGISCHILRVDQDHAEETVVLQK